MMNTLYLDTEATGPDPDKDQVVELAIGVGDLGCVMWRFKPSIPIGEGAMAVHGITNEDIEACPTFAEREPDVSAQLRNAGVIVGYNIDFDLRILRNEYHRIGKPWPVAQETLIIDVYGLWRVAEPRNLSTAFKRFVGAEHEGAHQAMADIHATRKVLEAMLVEFGLEGLSWEELALQIDPSRARRFGPSNHLEWNDAGLLIITFGKHAGTPMHIVPLSYLAWIIGAGNFPKHVVDACKVACTKGMTPERLYAWARSYR